MKNKPKTPARRPPAQARKKPAQDPWLQFLELCERCSLTPVIQNSYVLSRLWAWFSHIEWGPQLKVPVPRFLTYRDP